MPLSKLRQLRNDLDILISEIENGPRREIDIAEDHTGDPALIAEVVRVEGDKTSGKWYQVERIYCSLERCPNCPHGDFWYEYQVNKKRKTFRVSFREKALDSGNLGFYEITEEGDAIRIVPPREHVV